MDDKTSAANMTSAATMTGASATDSSAAGSSAAGSSVQGWLRALEMTKPIAARPTRILPVIIDELAEKYGDAPALLSDRESFSFRTLADRALLIYPSGTTGLPKAANITPYRLLIGSLWFAGMMATRPSDRMYNCLPMYHSVGGVVATGAVLVNGGSVVIRDKFSASQLWDDIRRYDCTMFQYIGELCRYLLNDPPPLAREAPLRVRLCCG